MYPLYVLDEVASRITDNIAEIILMKARARGNPKTDIFEARRVLGIRFESIDFSLLKLREEPEILGPEETDIRYREENHRYSFKPKSKCPADFVLNVLGNMSESSLRESGTYVQYQGSLVEQHRIPKSPATFPERTLRPQN